MLGNIENAVRLGTNVLYTTERGNNFTNATESQSPKKATRKFNAIC